MNLVNEKAVTSEDSFIRDKYKFDIFLQVVLTTVNGVTLGQGAQISDKDNSIIKRNDVPIANIYFKFQHKNKLN